MMSFLGLIGPWIHDFAEISQLLCDITHGGQHLAMTDRLTWTPDTEQAFTDLKQVLSSPPCLHLPDYTKPFNLCVSEKGVYMSAVLMVAGNAQRLSTTDRAMVACPGAVAAVSEAFLVTADIVAMHTLTVHVPHPAS